MTGLYPHKHKLTGLSSGTGGATPFYLPNHITMIDRMIAEETPHESAWFGKWHIGDDAVLKDTTRFDHRETASTPGVGMTRNPTLYA